MPFLTNFVVNLNDKNNIFVSNYWGRTHEANIKHVKTNSITFDKDKIVRYTT